jgi:hypothetical protein
LEPSKYEHGTGLTKMPERMDEFARGDPHGMVIEQDVLADHILIDDIGCPPKNDTGPKLFPWVIAATHGHRTYCHNSRCPLSSEVGSSTNTTPKSPGPLHPSRVQSCHEEQSNSNEECLTRGVPISSNNQQLSLEG